LAVLVYHSFDAMVLIGMADVSHCFGYHGPLACKDGEEIRADHQPGLGPAWAFDRARCSL